MEFSRQEYWSGLGCHSLLQGMDLPGSGMEPRYPAIQADSLPSNYKILQLLGNTKHQENNTHTNDHKFLPLLHLYLSPMLLSHFSLWGLFLGLAIRLALAKGTLKNVMQAEVWKVVAHQSLFFLMLSGALSPSPCEQTQVTMWRETCGHITCTDPANCQDVNKTIQGHAAPAKLQADPRNQPSQCRSKEQEIAKVHCLL